MAPSWQPHGKLTEGTKHERSRALNRLRCLCSNAEIVRLAPNISTGWLTRWSVGLDGRVEGVEREKKQGVSSHSWVFLQGVYWVFLHNLRRGRGSRFCGLPNSRPPPPKISRPISGVPSAVKKSSGRGLGTAVLACTWGNRRRVGLVGSRGESGAGLLAKTVCSRRRDTIENPTVTLSFTFQGKKWCVSTPRPNMHLGKRIKMKNTKIRQIEKFEKYNIKR